MYSSSNEVLSNWSRKISVGPSSYPTEFRLISTPLGNAPQFAHIGKSSSHFPMDTIPRGQAGLHPQVEYVPNFHKIAGIRSRIESQSPMVDIESIHAGHTFQQEASVEVVSKSVMSANPDSGWNQLASPKPTPTSPPRLNLPPILFTKGQLVLAKYHGGSEWRKAKVTNIIERTSGATWFDVTFLARSEIERGLPSYYLKPDPEAWAFRSGDKVQARYRGRASFHPAEIICLSPIQHWVGCREESSSDAMNSSVSAATRPMHEIGTDSMQLSQDYLLFDDHRSHHMGGKPLLLENECDLPDDYNPDLLLYDVRYVGGRTELAVPRHLIRFDAERQETAAPKLATHTLKSGSMVHEELGFVLRQRTNTARHQTLKETVVVPQVTDTNDDDGMSMSTTCVQEATQIAADCAGDMMKRAVPNSEEAMHVDTSDHISEGCTTVPFGSVNTMDLASRGSRGRSRRQTPGSSRLHRGEDLPDSLVAHVEEQMRVYSPPEAVTLAIDYTPPRLSMQERVAQQGHDRNVLRFNARRAYPDGVAVPSSSQQSKPNTANTSEKVIRQPAPYIEDDLSLGGWSGGTGFGASVGSFGYSSPKIEKPMRRKTSGNRRRTKSASGRRSRDGKPLRRSTAPSNSSGRMLNNMESSEEDATSLTGSLTIRDHPISTRTAPLDTVIDPL